MSDWKAKLEVALKGPLPGEAAHRLLRVRGGRGPSGEIPISYRDSAVLCLLSPDEASQVKITLVKRVSYAGWHSAQIAFPGGKPEAQDENLEATARRETLEEVGIGPAQYQILGRLTPVDVVASGFRLHPFLAWSGQRLSYYTDPREVDRVVLFPLADLISDHALTEGRITLDYPKGLTLHGPYFPLGEHQVWGATAMVLSELRWLLRGGI